MSEPQNLVERRNATVPGKWADFVDDLLYSHQTTPLTDDKRRKLRDLFHYLESLAFTEIEKELPKWIREYVKKKAQDPRT